MTSFRLSAGGRIDRSSTLGFSFDGKDFSGHTGDTLGATQQICEIAAVCALATAL